GQPGLAPAFQVRQREAHAPVLRQLVGVPELQQPVLFLLVVEALDVALGPPGIRAVVPAARGGQGRERQEQDGDLLHSFPFIMISLAALYESMSPMSYHSPSITWP